jgi:hypothetical protein
VIAGDVGEEIELVGGEAFEVAVSDEVGGVLVVAGVADVPADVVKEGGEFEELAVFFGEVMEVVEGVEEVEGELGDLCCMFFVEVAAACEFEDGAAAGVGVLDGEFDLGPVGVHVIDDHAFAEGAFADIDVCEFELGEDVVDDGGTGGDLVGAVGVEAGKAAAFLEVELAELFVDGVEVFAGHVGEEAVACGGFAVAECGHGGEIFEGAGGADEAARGEFADFLKGGLEGFFDVGLEFIQFLGREGIGGEELLGEAGGAEGIGIEEERFFVGGDDEFGGAAADVEDEGGTGEIAAIG